MGSNNTNEIKPAPKPKEITKKETIKNEGKYYF